MVFAKVWVSWLWSRGNKVCFLELFTFVSAARPGRDKSDGDACGDGGFVPRRYDHAGYSCLLIVRLIAERRHHGTKTMPDLGVHEQHIRALVYVDKLGDKQLLAVK